MSFFIKCLQTESKVFSVVGKYLEKQKMSVILQMINNQLLK